MQIPLTYKNSPLIGFDIGSQTVKLVQLAKKGSKTKVVGYGFASFPTGIVLEGIISDPKAVGDAVKPILKQLAIGKFTGKRVSASLPVAKTFVRTLDLPKMSKSDLNQAIELQSEQYIPMAASDLYMDYEVIDENIEADDKEPHLSVLLAASPRAIVDSYVQLFDYLNFEVDSFEISMAALARAIKLTSSTNQPILLVDFGYSSTGLTVFDKVLRFTGTVDIGSNNLTEKIGDALKMPLDSVNKLKVKFGIGPSAYQAKVLTAIAPTIDQLISEITKAIKYYEDRKQEAKITTVVFSGGGTNMPGLLDYIAKKTKWQVQGFDLWSKLQVKPLQLPVRAEKNIYDTAIGLALKGVGYD